MVLKQNKKVYFDELTHTYLMGEKELTGVTTMMKIMGVAPDYGDVPKEVLERAAARGGAVHKAIEQWCTGKPISVEQEFAEVVGEDLLAYKTTHIQPVANEYLVSDNATIASSIDIVADTGEPNTVDLIDIKTTSQVHKDAVAWQLSIYKHLFQLQNKGIRVARLWCLHIRDGKARMIEVEAVPENEVRRLLQCFADGELYNQEGIVLNDEQERAVKAIAELEAAIVSLDTQIKEKKAQQEALRGGIISLMRSHNVKKWEPTPNLAFTYIDPTTRTSIDSARLKKEQPEIYQAYLKESQVKESLRISIK